MERKAGGVLQVGYQEEKEPFLQSLKCRMANETSEDIQKYPKMRFDIEMKDRKRGTLEEGGGIYLSLFILPHT